MSTAGSDHGRACLPGGKAAQRTDPSARRHRIQSPANHAPLTEPGRILTVAARTFLTARFPRTRIAFGHRSKGQRETVPLRGQRKAVPLRRIIALSTILSAFLVLILAAQASADIGNSGDDLRTGWYPDESSLSPALVTSGSFGQLWSAPVNGQVYAQPLLSNGTVVVATETDNVYGLDPATGAQQWSDNLANPWNPADIGCADIQPWIGTTSTPVIDPTTNTVYLTYKTYASGSSGPAAWWMDALDVSSGATRPGFPVQLSGTAQNNPAATFSATDQQQRPGLLLMNGVVYAGFGSHCDYLTWQGWVFGVSTSGHVTARWVDNAANAMGAGIWQAGVGLTTDQSGSILLITGNEGDPSTPGPGNQPPATLGDSVVRLQVQPNGTLQPVDYFTPFDSPQLENFDQDFGSGALVGLPNAYFGTLEFPDLAVAVGKEGYLYLLNRDSLGGYDQGPGLGDNVVQRLGPRGGVWGRPGVWPGDGGYIYVTTASGNSAGGALDVYKYGLSGNGQPSLAFAGTSSDSFGWGSGPAVITSDGTTDGTALVWVIWSANRQGQGGQIRAYDPIPVNGHPVLVYSAPIGNATNYSQPGVGGGRLYIGTRDGDVLGFGSPVSEPLTGSALGFPATTIGNTAQQTLTLTATEPLTVQSIASTSGQFTIGTPSPTLPASRSAGQTISVPVTFAPTQTGLVAGQVNVTLNGGTVVPFSVSGTGQSSGAQLAVNQGLVSLGGTTIGGELTGSVTFSNVGAAALTITAVDAPAAPFGATGLPSVGNTIAPGGSITMTLSFTPTQDGTFTGTIEIDSTGGNEIVGLSGNAAPPGVLSFTSQNIDFGSVAVGTTATRSFTITNTGGVNVTLSKSKPPFGGEFSGLTTLDEGYTIAPATSVTEQVSFTPTATGPATGTWLINGNDVTGLHQVLFSGTGVLPGSGSTSPTPGGTSPPAGGVKTTHELGSPKLVPDVLTPATSGKAYFSYVAAAAGTTRFTLQRELTGRMVGGHCVATTKHNGRLKHCVRYVSVMTFEHADHVGVNRLHLKNFINIRKLTPGRYRLKAARQATTGTTAIYAPFQLNLARPHSSRAASIASR